MVLVTLLVISFLVLLESAKYLLLYAGTQQVSQLAADATYLQFAAERVLIITKCIYVFVLTAAHKITIPIRCGTVTFIIASEYCVRRCGSRISKFSPC